MTKEEPIHLKPYDPNWPQKFQGEKSLIVETLGSSFADKVKHVGSTSVPGLTAKPIIDIMVGVDSLEQAKKYIPLLESVGYNYYPYKSDRMHWFCKPSPQKRDFHLYLVATDHNEWKSRLSFRDYLESHPDIAKEYVELKTKLAEQYRDDREAYTQAKADFIQSVLGKIDPGLKD